MSKTPRTPLERVAHACMLLAIALRSSFSKPFRVLTAKVSQQSEMGQFVLRIFVLEIFGWAIHRVEGRGWDSLMIIHQLIECVFGILNSC